MADSIIEHLQREWELVWENESPDANFAAQTLSLDLSKYRFVRIEAAFTTATFLTSITDISIDQGISYLVVFNTTFYSTSTGTPRLYTRKADVTTTGITFSTGYYKNTNGTAAPTKGTNYIIPRRIWAR